MHEANAKKTVKTTKLQYLSIPFLYHYFLFSLPYCHGDQAHLALPDHLSWQFS